MCAYSKLNIVSRESINKTMKNKLKIGIIKFTPSATNPDGKLAHVECVNIHTMKRFTKKLSNMYRQGSIGEKVEYNGRVVVITGVRYRDGVNYYTVADLENLDHTFEVTNVKWLSKKATINEGDLWYVEEVGDYVYLVKKSKSKLVKERWQSKSPSLRVACLEEHPHLSFVSENDVVVAGGESIPLYTLLANADKNKNINYPRK